MGGITRQLKSYARKGDVDIEPVDLRDSVRAALSMMAPQLGKMAVRITTTLPSEPAIVQADPLRIEQIIVNLLRNALDAVRGRDDRRIKILLVAGRDDPLVDRGQRRRAAEDPTSSSSRSTPPRSPARGSGSASPSPPASRPSSAAGSSRATPPTAARSSSCVLPRDRGQTQAAE